MRTEPFVLQIKMLYLEDYLEMIEHLPIELRDRFTEMREIDLGVENTVDSLEVQKQSHTCNALTNPILANTQHCRRGRRISFLALQV